VTAQHASGSTSDAFDLVIKDTLPSGMTFISSTETNSGSGQNLEFHKAALLQGEHWQFTYLVRVDANATPGTLENSLELDWSSLAGADGGTHSGRDGSNCGQATPLNDYCDADKAQLQVVAPAVEIEKTVYLGHDNGASYPGVELAVGVHGKAVTYCFTINNIGDTYLNLFAIADNDLGITAADLTLISGTIPLAPNQSLVYYYESAINGDLTNTAGVTATPTDAGGSPIPGASNVTDTDTARVDEVAPQIEIAKTVYLGHDSGASCPGGEIVSGALGAEITYCFTVTNTGDTYLDDISITDNDLGINTSSMTLLSGSQPLTPAPNGGVLVYYYETTITGDLTNTATVNGNPTDANGADLPQIADQTDADTAQAVVARPEIDIQKTVYMNHDSGASCPGGDLVVGGNGLPITYCFTITNTGDTYLNNITIVDNDLGIDISDLTLHSGSQPLAPTGVLVYYYESTIAGDLTNTAAAGGQPTDSQGNIMPGVPNPTDSDSARVDEVHPGIDIQKTVYTGHDGGASGPGKEQVIGGAGTEITYYFIITNTGDTYLNNITFDDPNLGIDISDLVPVSGSQPLAPAGQLRYYYETTITAGMVNSANTSGIPSDNSGNAFPGLARATSENTAEAILAEPAVELLKTVYLGHDSGASCPGYDEITVNIPTDCSFAKVTYCFRITNTGNTFLADVTLSDPKLQIPNANLKLLQGTLPLAPSATISYYYETRISNDIVNTAEACGRPVDEFGADIPNVDAPCARDSATVTTDPNIPTLDEWGMIIFLRVPTLVPYACLRKRKRA
jgi:hypothetical protein